MKNMTRVMTATLMAGATLLGAVLTAPAAHAKLEAGDKGLESCFVRGAERLALCRTIQVPLDYAVPDGRQIDVHITVLPASGTGVLEDPIILFAGGPGQAAGELARFVKPMFRVAANKRDVVLVDARGTGKSTPLQCSFEDIEDQFDLDLIGPALEGCREGFDLDVRHINLETIVQDTEEARKVLGYEQMNLWGGSYGTRVVGHYLRRYPERVRSIIVDGVLPPDVKLFETAGQSAERAKTKLVEDCMARNACAERYPNLDQQINELAQKAKEGNLVFDGTDPYTGDPLVFPVPYETLVESIRSVMYSADSTVVLPFVVDAAYNGDLQPLMTNMFAGDTNGMYMGMTLSVLCGEEVSRLSPEQARAAGEGSFAGDTYHRAWSRNCAAWDFFTDGNGLPADLHDPLESDVPALILSGDLDPVTPPAHGDHWAATFPNSKHIVVGGTGHITSSVGCMPALIGEFMKDLDPVSLDDTCLAHLRRLPPVTGRNGQVN